MNNSQSLIAATATGFPLFVTADGLSDAFRQIDEHLSFTSYRPGYEFSLFHVLDVSDMTLHAVRRSNRPDADTNPYLTTAATVAAGVAGILGRIEPEAEVIGNGHAHPGGGPDFPRTMPEAIAAFRESAFARDWLGDRFVDAFAATRQSQHDDFRRKVPDVELQRFFDLG